jgi:hypothetical protein
MILCYNNKELFIIYPKYMDSKNTSTDVVDEDKMAEHVKEVERARAYGDNPLTASDLMIRTIGSFAKKWQKVAQHPALIRGKGGRKLELSTLTLADGKTVNIDGLILSEAGSMGETSIGNITISKDDGNGNTVQFTVNSNDSGQKSFAFNGNPMDYHTGSLGTGIASKIMCDVMEQLPEAIKNAEDELDRQAAISKEQVDTTRDEMREKMFPGLSDF